MNFKIALVAVSLMVAQHANAQQNTTYTLAQCRILALENNKKMKIAHFDIEAAKSVHQSVVAAAKPAIDGSLMGVYLGKPLGGGLGGMIPEYFANGSVTAAVPVYAGGKLKNGAAAAFKGIEITKLNRELSATEVLLDVEKAYWQVVQVSEKIVLANTYRKMLESLEKDLKNSHDAGLIYKNDLLQVQVSLNEAVLNIGKVEDGLVMAKLSLAQVIGIAGDAQFELSDAVTGDFQELSRSSLQLNAENRPEIKMLKKALEAQELQKKIVNGDRLPTFALAASGVGALGKKINVKDRSNSMATYYGLASISIPIFDWGRRSAKVKEQSFKVASAEQQLLESKEFVDLEVQNAYLQLNQSSRKIKLSDLSLQQSSENLRITQDRLKAGTIVGKDVLEAQAIWQQAYNNTIDARIEFKLNEAIYKKAIGELK